MIIFDNVYVKGFDKKEYILSFHIPLNKTTLIVLPSSVDKLEFAKYIAGLSTPVMGKVIHEFGEIVIKPTIYFPEQLSGELMILDVLNTLSPEVYRELVKIIRGIGYGDIDKDKLSIEIPDIVKKILLILFSLYTARYLSILIEPWLGLDNKLLSILSTEFKKLNSSNLTIVVLTNNIEFLKTEMDLYNYAVIVESEKGVIEGDRDKFRSRDIFAGLEIYEIWSRENVLNQLSNIEGFNGYLKIEKTKYLLFIDSKYKWVFLRKINELYRNRVVSYYRSVERELIGK